MIFPFDANKVESFSIDPSKKINGFIWFNTVEKVFKTYVDNVLHVFITDKNTETLVTSLLSTHQFTISFIDTLKIIIRHNKGKTNYTYNAYDSIENCNFACSMEIINDNEITAEFVDPVTGTIFLYFE